MATSSVLYSPYGAFEMKAKYQRNFLMATSITTGFVLAILMTFWIIAALSGEKIAIAPSVVIKSIAELGPPPSVAKKPPQVQVQAPQVAAPKVGIPKPVADEEMMDEDVVLATREELAEIVAPDITAIGDGDIVVDISDDDFMPAHDQFIPVEIYPEMIYEKTPIYPRLAKQAGLEGVVWVKALIDEDGNVLDAIIGKSSGTTALDEAALSAASANKFKPGIQNGRPIKVWVSYKVDFILTNE